MMTTQSHSVYKDTEMSRHLLPSNPVLSTERDV